MKQPEIAGEFLEAILHYRRAFKAHHINGTLKYSQDAYKTTVEVNDIKDGIAKRHMGIAGRASYNWNYRYFVDFNFGYNGSENFADGHRFGFFPAFSVAWNVAEEKFIKKHLKWMNMFKLRYSYGKVEMTIRRAFSLSIYLGQQIQTRWQNSNFSRMELGRLWL